MMDAQTAGEGGGAGADVVEGANILFTEAVGVVLLLLRPKSRNILSRLRVRGWDMTAPGKHRARDGGKAQPRYVPLSQSTHDRFLARLSLSPSLIYKVLSGHIHVSGLSRIYMRVGGIYARAYFVIHGRHRTRSQPSCTARGEPLLVMSKEKGTHSRETLNIRAVISSSSAFPIWWVSFIVGNGSPFQKGVSGLRVG
jgi:hypothetical protein